jgi:ribosomal-protein-alanine N-acetyltransferase
VTRDDLGALTARLRIEPLRAGHAPLLFDALADAAIYAYIPDERHAIVDSLARRYALLECGAPDGAFEVWLNWALQRLETGAYIGTLQATVMLDSRAYIGYVLTPSAWGRGFAAEACRWLVGELQGRYAVDEILATVDTRNLRSVRLLERLGFELIGIAPAEIRGEATTDSRYRLAAKRSVDVPRRPLDGMIESH